MIDRVTAVAEDIVAGRIVAGRLAILACRRHLADLEHGPARGLEWRPAESELALDFYPEVLCLPEETAADESVTADEAPCDGTPFKLSPWQAFLIGSLMGWYDSRGFRRFRVAYIETAKGSGKTPCAAGLLLYLLVTGSDRGGQFYIAATSRDQARLGFADAEKMVDASPALRAVIDRRVNTLLAPATNSFLKAISSEKRGLDGKRVSAALIDELHEHGTPIVVDKIRKATKGRRNALIIETTNAGFDRSSVCWQHHEYSSRVLEGSIQDDAWFTYIASMDPCASCLAEGQEFPREKCSACDDWKTEGPHWRKSNPNLGVSISWQYLRELVHQARGMPSAVSDLLRFNFSIWTQSHARFLDMTRWHTGQPFPSEDERRGVRCFAGLDLGQSDDLCGFVLVWAFPDGRLAVRSRFWIPESAMVKYSHRPYDVWRREGNLEVTEGDVTDYSIVEKTIVDDCRDAGVIELAYDKRFAHQMAQNLQGLGLTLVDTPQGFQLNEALCKVRDLVANGALCHEANPILTAMASHAVVRHGRNNEIRLDKERASDKIDGIAALTMAVSRVIAQPVAEPSVYDLENFDVSMVLL